MKGAESRVRMRKKCLYAITGAFSLGGGIAAVNRLVTYALLEAGYEVDIFALTETTSNSRQEYPDPTSLSYRVFADRKCPFVLAVWKAFLFTCYDLVIVDHINLASMFAPLSMLGLCQYIVWLFGIEMFHPKPDWEGTLGLKAASRRLAISEFTRQRALSHFPDLSIDVCELALDPIRHPKLSLDVSDTQPLSLCSINGTAMSLGQQVILHVGRMPQALAGKGQEVLIQAWPKILDKHPLAQLVLAGSGPGQPDLLTLALALPESIQGTIFMPGQVSDAMLNRLYHTCFLYAMPSGTEGFGLAYVEAMQYGKPCLGSATDASSCVIQDGITGLLVNDPNSADEVANRINYCLSNPAVALDFGKAGHRLVETHYLFPHFYERFLNILNDQPGASHP